MTQAALLPPPLEEAADEDEEDEEDDDEEDDTELPATEAALLSTIRPLIEWLCAAVSI